MAIAEKPLELNVQEQEPRTQKRIFPTFIEDCLSQAQKAGVPIFIGLITEDSKYLIVDCGIPTDLGLQLALGFKDVMREAGYTSQFSLSNK